LPSPAVKEVFHFLLSVEDIASSIKAGEGEENDGNEWGYERFTRTIVPSVSRGGVNALPGLRIV
jgi:hypothetical protein